MSNSSFRFKQFTVYQDRCAMKVGTDGTLLGAWARVGKRILDIGTGTGLIAMMMAQRCPESCVTAVEIDEAAYGQAKLNLQNSPFAKRVDIVNVSIQEFSAKFAGEKYDSIVCNPPFFVNSLGCPDAQRHIARHTSSLPFGELFKAVGSLITCDGFFAVVIPADIQLQFDAEARLSGFSCVRKCLVRTVERKTPKRVLLEYSLLGTVGFQTEEHCLTDASGKRSDWYENMTSEFYIR